MSVWFYLHARNIVIQFPDIDVANPNLRPVIYDRTNKFACITEFLDV